MGILWVIIIRFVARVIAKPIMPGRNRPPGFILTTVLGIVGAVVGALQFLIVWARSHDDATRRERRPVGGDARVTLTKTRTRPRSIAPRFIFWLLQLASTSRVARSSRMLRAS